MNASWTVKVERLEIELPVGIHADEMAPQPVWVSLAATGQAPASPARIEQCFDYEPLCTWLAREWPRTPHTPLLETRINQLLAFVFALDERVQSVWVGLYKKRMSRGAVGVGIERQATRLEFEAQPRCAAAGSSVLPSPAASPGKEPYAAVAC